jgi:hypothetical protein
MMDLQEKARYGLQEILTRISLILYVLIKL